MNSKYLFAAFFATSILFASCKEKNEPTPIELLPETPIELKSISKDSTLKNRVTDPTKPDYFVNSNISFSDVVTVAPGVVVEVDTDKRIEVSTAGAILSKGIKDKKVVFRGKTQTAGFWKGFIIYSGNEKNIFEYTEIAHTGSREILSGYTTAIALFGNNNSNPTNLSLKNTSIHHNAGYGLFVESGAELISFESNSFTDNAKPGVVLSADQVHKLDKASSYSNNSNYDVEIYKSLVNMAGEFTWPALRYKVTSVEGLIIRTGLTVSPGAHFEFAEDKTLRIEDYNNAYFKAVGTATNKITFTCEKKQAGAWRGIILSTNSDNNILEHVNLEYGGSSLVNGQKANVYAIFSSKIKILNSKISNSAGYGIYLNSAAQINGDFEQKNEFGNNTQGAFYRN